MRVEKTFVSEETTGSSALWVVRRPLVETGFFLRRFGRTGRLEVIEGSVRFTEKDSTREVPLERIRSVVVECGYRPRGLLDIMVPFLMGSFLLWYAALIVRTPFLWAWVFVGVGFASFYTVVGLWRIHLTKTKWVLDDGSTIDFSSSGFTSDDRSRLRRLGKDIESAHRRTDRD